MRVSLRVGPEDVQGATRENGHRVRSLFLPSGEAGRTTAILEHFGWEDARILYGVCVDLVSRDSHDSRGNKLYSSDHGLNVGMHLDSYGRSNELRVKTLSGRPILFGPF
jgi:hypothetical protein